MHDVVDLRSDTVTLPTPAMREAMARAEVGDDVWEEDPTVQRLEALAAERTGKEAGLFAARKVKIHKIGPASVRCVTHKDVDREDVDRALEAFSEITRGW